MDYIIVIIALIFGFSLKNRYSILDAKEHILLDQLFFYHMFMSFVFFNYITINGGDAQGYWRIAKIMEFEQLWMTIISGNATASHYLFLINYIPSNLLNLSFFSGCILYGILGYWAIVYLVVILKETFPLLYQLKRIKILNISIFPTILFLPNFHFWSGGIGKDTLLFYCAGAFFYALLNLKRRWHVLIPVVLIAYTIRPHMLLFLMAGFAVAYVLKSKLFVFQKVLFMGVAFVFFLPMLGTVLEFAKMDELSLEAYSQFGEGKAGALAKGAGSGIELSSLPYPLQVFTFLYRPLFFDANNILALLASFESLIWLILTFNFINNKPLRVFKNSHLIILAAFAYWLIGALAFAPVMGNLGIIIRERNMFLPGFIIFAVAGLYNTVKFRQFEWFHRQEKEKYLEEVKKAEVIAQEKVS